MASVSVWVWLRVRVDVINVIDGRENDGEGEVDLQIHH